MNYEEVDAARRKAHLKHMANSIECLSPRDPRWLSILGEEFGEVCNSLTYDGKGNLRAELIDLLSVASAWVSALDRERAHHGRMHGFCVHGERLGDCALIPTSDIEGGI